MALMASICPSFEQNLNEKNKVMNIIQTMVPYDVPYYAQAASPEWIGRILDEQIPAEQDPAQNAYGAVTADEYAWWVPRACGMVCVKMVVEALGGPKYKVMDWVRRGLEKKGYLIEQDPYGDWTEKGWLHSCMVGLIAEEGFNAFACEAGLDDIASELQHGRLVIASVSFEIGTDLPITRRGGHLVVVTGVETIDGKVAAALVHNPSGRRENLRVNAHIPADRFKLAFKNRVIVAEKKER
jgi:hypothetical protein